MSDVCARPGDRTGINDAEFRTRVELAALYRLIALHGWDDLIYTHVSARLPGPEHHFLINPYGMLFDEINASSLVKIDLDGNVLQDTPYDVNRAGFVIHSALHAARPDAWFVIHLHTAATIAVSAQKHGLLPISQHALAVLPMLGYHDYEGIALDADERERIVADMGEGALLLLRNHGSLALAPSAAECWARIHFLQRACEAQVLALASGLDNVLLLDSAKIEEVRAQTRTGFGGDVAWAGCLRRLERLLPGYDV
jgi:ribulose-5-phosphate 4-epimerase/fuculose-1-phosphate aldolase